MTNRPKEEKLQESEREILKPHKYVRCLDMMITTSYEGTKKWRVDNLTGNTKFHAEYERCDKHDIISFLIIPRKYLFGWINNG